MPRKIELTWEPGPRRWRRVYQGKTYTVSCRKLGVPDNQRDSYRAANEWWERTLAGIIGRNTENQAKLEEIHRAREAAQGRHVPAPEPEPTPKAAPVDRTVKALIEKYLASQRVRVKAGEVTEAEISGRGYSLAHFERFLGPDSDIKVLTAERWQGWYESLLASDRSKSYASKLLNHSRWFVRFLDELDIHPAPRNLAKKSIKVAAQKIEVFPVEEVRRLWGEANPAVRLLIGLAINCGMTGKDISDLHPSEVDWGKGIIRRKRSKSRLHDNNAPVVTYAIWPEVVELLVAHRSSDPERVLVTKSGRPWVDRQERNTDNVRVAFGKLSPTLPFKHLRKTSASLLGSHPEFGRYAQHFLAHAPSSGSVADAHYVKPSEEQFARALTWLRDKYFGPSDS